jgi:8-oxo-dGTP pyrophosphatase MutT (NUDIX family)
MAPDSPSDDPAELPVDPPQNGDPPRDEDPPQDSVRWKELGSERGPDLSLFKVRFDQLEHPRSGTEVRAVVLETPDWANVVARTPDGRMVLVRQYRFGSRALSLEIAGGMVDAGEEPLEAARRELREETGFTSERWTFLGAVEPNPAFHDNLCHHFLAEDAVQTHPQELDPGEDVEVVLLTPAEVESQVRDGRIRNSLVVSALGRVLDLRVGSARE